jgi:hypothetical protein
MTWGLFVVAYVISTAGPTGKVLSNVSLTQIAGTYSSDSDCTANFLAQGAAYPQRQVVGNEISDLRVALICLPTSQSVPEQ